jgi:hypothetical protein
MLRAELFRIANLNQNRYKHILLTQHIRTRLLMPSVDIVIHGRLQLSHKLVLHLLDVKRPIIELGQQTVNCRCLWAKHFGPEVGVVYVQALVSVLTNEGLLL